MPARDSGSFLEPQELIEGEKRMGTHSCQIDLLPLARSKRKKEKLKYIMGYASMRESSIAYLRFKFS